MKIKIVFSYICLQCIFYQVLGNNMFTCADGSKNISSALVCSGASQCSDCSDEFNCSTHGDFLSCGSEGPPYCINPVNRCNGSPDCDNCADELNCPNITVFHCDDSMGCVDFSFGGLRCDPERPDFHSCPFFCDGVSHCGDESDEKTVGFGFKCVAMSSGLLSNPLITRCVIPQRYLGRPADQPSICQNEADQACIIGEKDGIQVFNQSLCWSCLDGTIIQRNQVCDQIFDCADLSDECLCFRDTDRNNEKNFCALFLNGKNCSQNQVSCPNEDKCIDRTDICNTVKDCQNGDDEAYCNRTQGENCMPTNNDFECHRGNKVVLNRRVLQCDGIPDCVFAEDECESNCSATLPEYCVRLQARQFFDNRIPCENSPSSSKFVAVEQICDKIEQCPDGFDESECPTIRSCGSSNTSNRYDFRECGPDRCNLVPACTEHFDDEMDCPLNTHFYCDENTKFISQALRFDGSFDCQDYTDECMFLDSSVSSRTHLVGIPGLRVFLWILMFLALIGNGIVIIRTLLELSNALRRRLHCTINRVGVCNKIMIVNLAAADFLMGIYLLVIAIKSEQFSGKYCRFQQKWLTSDDCAYAGILAVIASQTSVFLMVLMTTYRLHGIANPFSAERIRGRMIYLATVVIWIISVLLAVIPTFPSLQASFISGIFVTQPYGRNLLTMYELSDFLIATANRLPGINNTIPLPDQIDIDSFCRLFEHSSSVPPYCQDSGVLKEKYVAGYYGSDGVCLPRYYASFNDPGSGYSIAILSINFAAFLYMFLAYLFIYHSTSFDVKQGARNSGSVDENRSKENQALWGKIVRLIVTNFLCWMPICIMAFVSILGVRIPGIIYPITAVVLIPINSAANPWLYSSFLADYITRLYRYIKQISRRKRKSNAQGSGSSSRRRYARFRRYGRRKSSMDSSVTFSVRLSTTGAASAGEHNGVSTQTNGPT